MAGAGEAFLDLALALPIPPDWPKYTTAIIVTTVASRLMFTLPFSVMARRRNIRVDELVEPELKAASKDLQKEENLKMIAEGVRGTQEQLNKMYRERFKKTMQEKRKELMKKHNASSGLTTTLPALTQLPLFFGMSAFFARLSYAPYAGLLDTESFFTLSSITHADPTATIPVLLGFITLANTESANWFMPDRVKAADERDRKRVADAVARKEFAVPAINRLMRPAMRMGAIVRIVVAMIAPGTVQIYWLTSAAFGLLQTWVFDFMDKRRYARKAARKLAEAASVEVASSTPSPTPTSPSTPKRKRK
ncbi:hypothetical protein PENSPDRAFT_679391 [Peniophora sp. CONT]|nr:hypothetical protein PENSPDRAFT_679391 [Peniophora sp. CONT]